MINKNITILMLIFIVGASIYLLLNRIYIAKTAAVGIVSISQVQVPIITYIPTVTNFPNLTPTPLSKDGLKNTVEKVLKGSNGTYGIVIKNFKTNEEYYYNENTEFHPASLYKLWIMATTFNQIQNGQIKKDDILSQDVQVLNNEFDIDPQLAELTEGTITMTVKDALDKMITVSDNYAALLLSDRLPLSTVTKFLQNNNFTESRLGEPPLSTPYDIALFLEKLYFGELADEKNTNEMIDLLKRQTLNNKLPKYLPQNLSIAHKTGEIESFSHDAGIVYTEKGDYIIVVMTESDDPADAKRYISQISKTVFDYFQKNPIKS